MNNNNNIIIMSLFNEDNIFSNIPISHMVLSRAKIQIQHNYLHIYIIKTSGRPKHCMGKYDKLSENLNDNLKKFKII